MRLREWLQMPVDGEGSTLGQDNIVVAWTVLERTMLHLLRSQKKVFAFNLLC